MVDPRQNPQPQAAASGFGMGIEIARHMLDAMPIACAMYWDDDGALAHANPVFSALFGTPEPDPDIDTFEARFQSYDVRSVEASTSGVHRSLRQGEPLEVYEPGSGHWYSMYWCALEHTSEVPCSLIFAVNNTEQRDALNSRMSRQEKLLFLSRTMSVGEMATAMAHELNQPLAAAVNYLDVGLKLLDGGQTDKAHVREALQLARSQARHASAVVSHMREFVQAREPTRETHSVGSIVDNVAQLIHLEIQNNRVRLTMQVEPDLPSIMADRVMIEQVLLNLLKNAIEAMSELPPAARHIVMNASRTLDGEVEIRVSDHGCGVSADEQERLFSPFFTTKPDGFGVGLAICRSIMEYHGGRLYFERGADDTTDFAITLPV